MRRVKCLTMEEAVALVLASDSEDEEAVAVQESQNVDIVYVPPPVDQQSDEENINEDVVERDR